MPGSDAEPSLGCGSAPLGHSSARGPATRAARPTSASGPGSDDAFVWLADYLDVEEFQRLLPETASLPVTRHVLPNLRALNFVVDGLLGEGVASNARHDPQAKALGEWLRSRVVDIPEALLA